ncbi:hypothetical protein ROBYS_44610 [Roseobacter sp. OBYS 0001]|nr:hypothetical protein ROBYS_44610 [Roseobacter sp. OBYS 0001]
MEKLGSKCIKFLQYLPKKIILLLGFTQEFWESMKITAYRLFVIISVFVVFGCLILLSDFLGFEFF